MRSKDSKKNEICNYFLRIRCGKRREVHFRKTNPTNESKIFRYFSGLRSMSFQGVASYCSMLLAGT